MCCCCWLLDSENRDLSIRDISLNRANRYLILVDDMIESSSLSNAHQGLIYLHLQFIFLSFLFMFGCFLFYISGDNLLIDLLK